MVAWLAAYRDARRDGDWLAYLWLPHIEHRVPLVRVLVAGDVALTHGSGLVLVCAATLAVTITACMVYRLVGSGAAGRPFAWLAVMAVLTTEAAVDCSAPANIIYPLAVTGVVAAVLLFRPARPRTWRRVAAFGAAILAGFSCAWGLAVWPALAWLAWRGGARGWVAGILVAAAAYAGLYTYPATVALLGGAWRAAMAPAQFAGFLIAFAGLPLTRDAGLAPLGSVLGVAMLGAGAAALALPARGDGERVAGQALIVAGLAGAVLVAMGRAAADAGDHVPVRYSFLLVPLQVGLLMVALSVGRRWVMGAARVAACLLVLQVGAAGPAIRIAAARRDPGMSLRQAGWGEAAPPSALR